MEAPHIKSRNVIGTKKSFIRHEVDEDNELILKAIEQSDKERRNTSFQKQREMKLDQVKREIKVRLLEERIQILAAAKKDNEETRLAIMKGEEILKLIKENIQD